MELLNSTARPCPGDALIVIPPFAALERPAFGPHLLQACARAEGFQVTVLYANLLLAAKIGARSYTAMCYTPIRELMGERVFAATAYGSPSLGGTNSAEALAQDFFPLIELADIRALEVVAAKWLDDLVAGILQLGYDIIGCSTSFQQTAASVALLKRVKQRRSDIVTILGGANCEGEMAQGILSLDGGVDFVFSGESETTFPKFLRDVQSGRLSATRVVQGQPSADLDRIPTPSFAEYYEQFERFLPDQDVVKREDVWLPYETSRGCWWGEKHHCTFCGLNGEAMSHRAKSPDQVITELSQLLKAHPSNRVTFVDNIMPHGYFRSLIPRLGTELPGLHMFYEQKSNLSLANVVALRKAGLAVIQPGIEALSSSLLRRMDKGVTARQNIALLRYARAVDLSVTWNLLWRIPGDQLGEYEQTLEILPLLRHLHPPAGLFPLMIDRFSPYFDDPERFAIRNLRPWPSYAAILPDCAHVAKVAYHFDGDYPSGSREHPDLMQSIGDQVEAWRRCWELDAAPPVLAVVPMTDEQLLLYDTRGIPGTREIHFLTRDQARLVLAGVTDRSDTALVEWALQEKLVTRVDSDLVPLATAEPELIAEFEEEVRRSGASRRPLARACGRDEPVAISIQLRSGPPLH